MDFSARNLKARDSRDRNLAMKVPGGRYSVMNDTANFLASQLSKKFEENPFVGENP